MVDDGQVLSRCQWDPTGESGVRPFRHFVAGASLSSPVFGSPRNSSLGRWMKRESKDFDGFQTRPMGLP